MSAKNRGAKVLNNEAYDTPARYINDIWQEIDPGGKRILEPGCGNAPFLRAAKGLGASECVGVDIREVTIGPWVDTFITQDYVGSETLDDKIKCDFDIAVCNPPFSMAEGFVERSMHYIHNDGIVVCLWRLSALEGQKRYRNFWSRNHLKQVYILVTRPRFYGGGDADAYAYFVFNKSECNTPSIKWISAYKD